MIKIMEIGLDAHTRLPTSIREKIEGIGVIDSSSLRADGMRMVEKLYRVVREIKEICLNDGDMALLLSNKSISF